MGLLNEGINEVIASTRFNAAPMGVFFRGGRFSMVLFSGSHTARNIESEGWVVANIVQDPVLYVTTAFSDLAQTAFLSVLVNGREMHRLAHADAWQAFDVTIEHRGTESLTALLSPLHEEIISPTVRPVNRGFNSIIEATVHATRYAINRDPSIKRLIDYHAGIVRKCGGKREWEALDLLMNYIR
ncbi:MAG: DUF447 family protein [Methanoregula sp.]|nr:MAG: DUF447 family protein [Methanoregula sp.]